MQRHRKEDDRPKLVFFEHDHRFDVFPEFVYYDFQHPMKLPGKQPTTLPTNLEVLEGSAGAPGSKRPELILHDSGVEGQS